MIDVRKGIRDHAELIGRLEPIVPRIEEAARVMTHAIAQGNKILWMGNGGSAADAQHLAAEFVGRFARERQGLPSIALTTDTSVLTAIANDYGYDAVFTRQIQALCSPGDVVVGISTSGNSKNVLGAVELARKQGAVTVGFAGGTGGKLVGSVDLPILVPSSVTARIQECHILIGHLLCDWVEASVTEARK